MRVCRRCLGLDRGTGRCGWLSRTRGWHCFSKTNVSVWRVTTAVERGETGRGVLTLAGRVHEGKLSVRKSRLAAFRCDVACGLPGCRGGSPSVRSMTSMAWWARSRLCCAPSLTDDHTLTERLALPHLEMTAWPGAVPCARHHAREFLPVVRLWLVPEPDSVLVLVWDGCPLLPERHAPGLDDDNCRGLLLVERLRAAWAHSNLLTNLERWSGRYAGAEPSAREGHASIAFVVDSQHRLIHGIRIVSIVAMQIAETVITCAGWQSGEPGASGPDQDRARGDPAPPLAAAQMASQSAEAARTRAIAENRACFSAPEAALLPAESVADAEPVRVQDARQMHCLAHART